MMWARNRKKRAGFSIVELATAIAILGPILLCLTIFLEVGLRYFVRAQAAQLYHLHVEPLHRLLTRQVRVCHFAVYNTLQDARAQNTAAIIPTGNVLRLDRQDGGGWFILNWDSGSNSLQLITDGSNGLIFTRSIRLWQGQSCLFDTSQGFLALDCALAIPTPLSTLFGNTVTEVDYVLTAEQQL